MNPNHLRYLLPLLGSLFSMCSSCSPRPPCVVEPHLHTIRKAAKPLHSGEVFTPAETAYLDYYGLKQGAEVDHQFGYLHQGNRSIATHWITPPNPSRLIVICHGYFDHAGTWNNAIGALLDAGNSVLIYDQPGHGLSSGDRAHIEDFGDYVDVLENLVNHCHQQSDLPVALVGHSMGCAVITEYLLDRQGRESHAVFIAPLIRSKTWHLSKISHAAFGWLFRSVPRVFRKNSSDGDYLAFVENDPLHARRVPSAWTQALFDWNQRAQGLAPRDDCQIRILQGAADSTVDWGYNRVFLTSKLPASTARLFPGGKHQLVNEAEPLLTEVLRELVAEIERFPASK